MTETLEQKLNIPANHKLIQTSSGNKRKGAEDTDYWSYDEVDESGNIIAKYSVTEEMNIYTQKITTSFTRTEVNPSN